MKLQKYNYKRNTLVLCFISAFAVCFLSFGVMAKYTTAFMGQSSARVAAPIVTMSVASVAAEEINYSQNSSIKIGTITVSNSSGEKVSEVAMRYTITLTSTVAFPSNMTPQLKNGSTIYSPSSVSTDRKTFTFSSADFTLPVSSTQNTRFDVTIVSTTAAPPDSVQNYSITASIDAEQVD